nr:receptor-like cytosolic serine/threonine-protein kinase RBK2 [Ipomoea batatas]
MVNANSPDTVLEDYLDGLVSETDTTKSSILEFESESYEKRNSKWDGFLQLCSMREAACGSGLLQSPILEGGLSYFKPQWKNFSLSEIEIATNNFHHENLIGKGGYAEVHKGRLRDGKLVAVNRLTRGAPEERIGDFLSELGIMAHLNHPNTTKLIGYGVEGGYYLVLELSPHGSLASMLHGIRYVAALDFSLSYCLFFLSIYLSTVFTVSKQKPGWYIRYKVALGTAKGLQYLHEGSQRRIIHRDIKATNILLMEDFEPQNSQSSPMDDTLSTTITTSATHIDIENPYYLHSSDGTGTSLVGTPLVGIDNYTSWALAMTMALRGRNKFCFVDGTLAMPDVSHPDHTRWKRVNNIVMSWILNSIHPSLAHTVLHCMLRMLLLFGLI